MFFVLLHGLRWTKAKMPFHLYVLLKRTRRLRSKLVLCYVRKYRHKASVWERGRSCALHSHIACHEGWRVSQPSSVWRRVRAHTDPSRSSTRERGKKRRRERERKFVVLAGYYLVKWLSSTEQICTWFINLIWIEQLDLINWLKSVIKQIAKNSS